MLTLYATAMLLSAALLFLVQPMFGKMALPLFGGAAAVWNTCMVFFQTALLAAYLYAHLLTARLRPRAQALVHAALVLSVLAALPIGLRSGSLEPGGGFTASLLLGLALSVGAPFFALATTAPLLQHWFAALPAAGGPSPFSLYAVSNAGSLAALAAYPLVVERHFAVETQIRVFTWAYVAFAVLIIACAVSIARADQPAPSAHHPPAPDPAGQAVDEPRGVTRRRLVWVALAAAPSTLLLSVTAHATTNLAPSPLLWTVPLALYLLTFILAFARPSPSPRLARAVAPAAALAVATSLLAVSTRPVWAVLALHLGAFFLLSLACHVELARRRPAPARLTEYYVCLSAGGALGGAFNALAAPRLFTSLAEYPIGLALACFVLPNAAFVPSGRTSWRRDLAWALGILAFSAAAARLLPRAGVELGSLVASLVAVGLPLAACALVWPYAQRFALGLGAVLLAGAWSPAGHVLHAERNFFGVVTATLDATGRYRQLVHGDTVHGAQALDPLRRREALAYYHATGPIGRVLDDLNGRGAAGRVAVVGLGIGSLAAYGRPGQQWTFYEINPAVERLATNAGLFTYLADCEAAWDVVLGDGRLALARAPDHVFDAIVLDAFASDVIPVHLVTAEAVDLYLRKLKPGGVLAFHISNRYLDLGPVLAALAERRGLDGAWMHHRTTAAEQAQQVLDSTWVVASADGTALAGLRRDERWQRLATRPGVAAWTDGYSNLFAALKWRD